MERVQLIPAEKSKWEILPFAIYLAGEMNKVRRHHSLEGIFRYCWCSKCQLCCEGQWSALGKDELHANVMQPSLSIQSCAKLICYKWELFHRNLWDVKRSCSFLFSQYWGVRMKMHRGICSLCALEPGNLQSVQHWDISPLVSQVVTARRFFLAPSRNCFCLHLIRI